MWNENVTAKCFNRLAKLTGGALLKRILLVAPFLLPMAPHAQAGPMATLPGHVLGILPNATPLPRGPNAGRQPLTLGVMLNLSDQAAFDAFSKDFEDPNSPNFHISIAAADFTARFGPTQEAYDTVLAYLQRNGFTLVAGSNNRRTITVKGTRAQAESAFQVTIGDYQLGSRAFQAIGADPAFPEELAPLIAGVSGLNNLSQWQPGLAPSPPTPASTATAYNGALTAAGVTNSGGLPPGLDGTGQTIGLIEFDNYKDSDMKHWLHAAGLSKDLINQLSRFPVNGGTSPSGCDPYTPPCTESEVLLDIAAVLGIAPGAKIIVFEGPSGTDDYTMVNAVINELSTKPGSTISMSWSRCESEISESDAANMDNLLKGASIYSITMFANTGDYGSGCFDGSSINPNTIAYPADAPHAIAVGGTSLAVGAGNEYSSESWWLNGGYGVSQFKSLPEPGYQVPFYPGATGRSVPDVSMQASPGMQICQGYVTGAPSTPYCFAREGTSLATPLWAAVWALANQAQTDETGGDAAGSASTGFFYTIPNAFHKASSMTGFGNDFYHLGLGSPDIPTVVSLRTYYTEVDSISPKTGTADGGTTVTIEGKGFVGVKKVTFGGVDATNVTIYSDSKLTADSPAITDSQVDIQVVAPVGTSAPSGKDLFTYTPSIDKIKPNYGGLDGGTNVTITGKGFDLTSTKFTFGWAPATNVSCPSSTTCTMVTPAWGSATPVGVVVETSLGSFTASSSADQFTYEASSISSFSPNVGPTTGNMTVKLKGIGLDDSMTVKFGSGVATGVSCGSSSTECSVTSPAGAVGSSVPLTVTTGGVTSAPTSGKFTFALFPTVTAVMPNIGVLAGATVVISGTNFNMAPGGTTFTFGSQVATGVNCSTTQCSVVVPGNSDSSTALVPVEATVNGHTSLDAATFTYGDSAIPIVPIGTCKTCHL